MRLIDADALLETLGVTEGCNNCQYSVGNHCFRVGYSTITCKAIANAPTILPQMEWIPCSERLPCDGIPVNITWVNRKPVSYYVDIKDKHFTATGIYYRGKWFWYSWACEDLLYEYGNSKADAVDEDVEIVAWMPLPEPYKENKL